MKNDNVINFFDLKRISGSGFLIIPILNKYLDCCQSPKKIYQFLKFFLDKATDKSIDFVLLYESSGELIQFKQINHKQELLSIVKCKNELPLGSFHILSWNYIVLQSPNFLDLFSLLKKSISHDPEFRKVLDFEKNRKCSSVIGYDCLLIEALVVYLIRQKLVPLPGKFNHPGNWRIVAYPGILFSDFYIHKFNVLPINKNIMSIDKFSLRLSKALYNYKSKYLLDYDRAHFNHYMELSKNIERVGDFPPQKTTKKMHVKAFFSGSEKDREIFKRSRCVLPISVGRDYHESEKFSTTINLISDNFKECVIVVCDSLQRHNLSLGNPHSDISPYLQVVRLGDQWIARNQSLYKNAAIPFSVYRWDNWLKSPKYPKQKKMVDELYASDRDFSRAVLRSVENFLYRSQNIPRDNFDYNKALMSSIEYVKEECAIMPMWVEEGFHFEVYPGEGNSAMFLIRERFLHSQYPNLLRQLRVDFKYEVSNAEVLADMV